MSSDHCHFLDFVDVFRYFVDLKFGLFFFRCQEPSENLRDYPFGFLVIAFIAVRIVGWLVAPQNSRSLVRPNCAGSGPATRQVA